MSVNSKMTAIADAIRNLLDISGTMGLDAMASNISSITKRGAVAGTISTKSEQYIIPAGYYNGNGSVGIDDAEQAKIIAENIKNGVTILGVSGTASGDIFAVISVTYPEGSVCTCSDGTITLTARDTSGKALFNVPNIGTWTVTAKTTDGSKEKSVDVTITAEGQVTTITLSYELFLYNAGNEYTDITGGWTSNGYTSSRTVYAGTKYDTYMYFPAPSDYDSIYMLGTNNIIQLKNYSKLIVSVESSTNNHCVVTKSKTNFPSGGNPIAYKELVNGENELDISSLESGYIALYATTVNSSFKVTKVRAV